MYVHMSQTTSIPFLSEIYSLQHRSRNWTWFTVLIDILWVLLMNFQPKWYKGNSLCHELWSLRVQKSTSVPRARLSFTFIRIWCFSNQYVSLFIVYKAKIYTFPWTQVFLLRMLLGSENQSFHFTVPWTRLGSENQSVFMFTMMVSNLMLALHHQKCCHSEKEMKNL